MEFEMLNDLPVTESSVKLEMERLFVVIVLHAACFQEGEILFNL